MKDLTAKDIMSTEVESVPEDMTVHELAAFFTQKMISGAPVVNEKGDLTGVVSLSDIVRHDGQRVKIVNQSGETDYYLQGWEDDYDEDDFRELRIREDDGLVVRDIMTPLVFKVPESESLAEMADIMIDGRIHRLFVTDQDKIVGIVTSLDMLKAIRTHSV